MVENNEQTTTPAGGSPAVNAEISAIAESGNKNLLVIAIIVIGAITLLFFLLGGDDEPAPVEPIPEVEVEDEPEPPLPTIAMPPPQPVIPVVPDIPTVAPPPPPEEPVAIEPQPVAPPPPIQRSKIMSEAEKQRLQASSLVLSGRPTGSVIGGAQGGSTFFEGIEDSSAPSVEITKTSDPKFSIYQGKVIDAVLETAISTAQRGFSGDEGMLRAVVSRDVYSESGKHILIPKGSRLIGEYDTQVSRLEARITIGWTRVIRPDGLDIAIGSPVVDNLGRPALPADVDSRFLETLGNFFLLSALTIGFAASAEGLTGAEGTTKTETSGGSSEVSGSATDAAIQQSVTGFGDRVLGQIIGGLQPIVTIDQGTHIKVFVNKDIRFPPSITSEVQVIR